MVMVSFDGLKDSLTQLACPAFLYEQMRREQSHAARAHTSFSLVRIVLVPPEFSGSPDGGDEQIIAFAHLLSRSARGEDLCARMGEMEFLCLLHGEEQGVSHFTSRIINVWVPGGETHSGSTWPRLEITYVRSCENETSLDLLNRLDAQGVRIDTSCHTELELPG